MGKITIITSVIVALLGITTYHLGLFDRPNFEYHDFLLPSPHQELYAILATTQNGNIVGNVERLLQGTKDGLKKVRPQALMGAPKLYNAPNGATSLSVGLYFDDPNSIENPRWGIGWAVDVPSFEDVKSLERAVQNLFEGQEKIRAVRIGPGPILKAKIPWRTMLTPMIAPMLHWCRGFATYEKEGYATKYNDWHAAAADDKTKYDAFSCEIYVTGENDSLEYIDYIILMGDLEQVYEDSFPSKNQENSEQVEEPDVKKPTNDEVIQENDEQESANKEKEQEETAPQEYDEGSDSTFPGNIEEDDAENEVSHRGIAQEASSGEESSQEEVLEKSKKEIPPTTEDEKNNDIAVGDITSDDTARGASQAETLDIREE